MTNTIKYLLHKPEFLQENETQTHHLISVRWPDLVIIKKKRELAIILRFCRPSWSQKKSKRGDKYLDLARELRKPWNMRSAVILIVIGILERVPEGFERELGELETRGPIEIIKTTALLRSTRILRIVLLTCGDLLSLWLQWKTIMLKLV